MSTWLAASEESTVGQKDLRRVSKLKTRRYTVEDSALERVFNADERRDLVAQAAVVESGQEIGVQQQPPCEVDLKPDSAAEFVDVSRLESDVGKNRSAVERVEVFTANDRRVDDVAAKNVERYSHARVDGHDRTD